MTCLDSNQSHVISLLKTFPSVFGWGSLLAAIPYTMWSPQAVHNLDPIPALENLGCDSPPLLSMTSQRKVSYKNRWVTTKGGGGSLFWTQQSSCM